MPGPAFQRGDRVTLRPVERDDAAFLQRGHNDRSVRAPLGLSSPQNRNQIEEGIEEWVESDDSINLLACIEEDGDPVPVGDVSVIHARWDRPDLAYWFLPEYQGEGYATEAVSLLLDYVFATFDKRGVHARVYDHNEPSQRLLERLGFQREGRLRDGRFVEGEYRDVFVYGLLHEEWTDE